MIAATRLTVHVGLSAAHGTDAPHGPLPYPPPGRGGPGFSHCRANSRRADAASPEGSRRRGRREEGRTRGATALRSALLPPFCCPGNSPGRRLEGGIPGLEAPKGPHLLLPPLPAGWRGPGLRRGRAPQPPLQGKLAVPAVEFGRAARGSLRRRQEGLRPRLKAATHATQGRALRHRLGRRPGAGADLPAAAQLLWGSGGRPAAEQPAQASTRLSGPVSRCCRGPQVGSHGRE